MTGHSNFARRIRVPSLREGVPRNGGLGGEAYEHGVSQVLIERAHQRLFGPFLTAQKGTRPAGRNPPYKNTNRRTAMAETMTVQ